MSFGYGTRITTPGGEVEIERISSGDQVLFGRLEANGPVWAPAALQFGDGDPGGTRKMLFLSFETGEGLVCTLDQPLMRADRRMIRAQRLEQGDELLAPDGTARAIAMHAVGPWNRGVHGIAATFTWTGTPNGHLIAAGGVVAGDYMVEVNLPRDV